MVMADGGRASLSGKNFRAFHHDGEVLVQTQCIETHFALDKLNQVEATYSRHLFWSDYILCPAEGGHQVDNKKPATDNKKPRVPHAKQAQARSPQAQCEETREVHCTAAPPFRVILCLSR